MSVTLVYTEGTTSMLLDVANADKIDIEYLIESNVEMLYLLKQLNISIDWNIDIDSYEATLDMIINKCTKKISAKEYAILVNGRDS